MDSIVSAAMTMKQVQIQSAVSTALTGKVMDHSKQAAAFMLSDFAAANPTPPMAGLGQMLDIRV